jgi:hypothetical protein
MEPTLATVATDLRHLVLVIAFEFAPPAETENEIGVVVMGRTDHHPQRVLLDRVEVERLEFGGQVTEMFHQRVTVFVQQSESQVTLQSLVEPVGQDAIHVRGIWA